MKGTPVLCGDCGNNTYTIETKTFPNIAKVFVTIVCAKCGHHKIMWLDRLMEKDNAILYRKDFKILF